MQVLLKLGLIFFFFLLMDFSTTFFICSRYGVRAESNLYARSFIIKYGFSGLFLAILAIGLFTVAFNLILLKVENQILIIIMKVSLVSALFLRIVVVSHNLVVILHALSLIWRLSNTVHWWPQKASPRNSQEAPCRHERNCWRSRAGLQTNTISCLNLFFRSWHLSQYSSYQHSKTQTLKTDEHREEIFKHRIVPSQLRVPEKEHHNASNHESQSQQAIILELQHYSPPNNFMKRWISFFP